MLYDHEVDISCVDDARWPSKSALSRLLKFNKHRIDGMCVDIRNNDSMILAKGRAYELLNEHGEISEIILDDVELTTGQIQDAGLHQILIVARIAHGLLNGVNPSKIIWPARLYDRTLDTAVDVSFMRPMRDDDYDKTSLIFGRFRELSDKFGADLQFFCLDDSKLENLRHVTFKLFSEINWTGGSNLKRSSIYIAERALVLLGSIYECIVENVYESDFAGRSRNCHKRLC